MQILDRILESQTRTISTHFDANIIVVKASPNLPPFNYQVFINPIAILFIHRGKGKLDKSRCLLPDLVLVIIVTFASFPL